MKTNPGNREFVQPWLNSAWSDIVFILSPPFLSLLVVCLFPAQFKVTSEFPLIYWLLLVVFIDVAHVYSTLYRTYFNPERLKRQSGLLLSIPLCCYVVGVLIYHVDGLLFWSVLAYLAVFHFVRQQYGFMRLYSRTEDQTTGMRRIDSTAIYTATIYPILYWHFSADRNFNWFVAGDFMQFPSSVLSSVCTYLYFAIIVVYLVKEVLLILKSRTVNIPRNVLVLGTFLSWYFGIVYFNGDMAFTTLNVISHGIPYMALIWFFEKKNYQKAGGEKSRLQHFTFGKYGLLIFVISIVLFAYVEEGLWDGLVWKEHVGVFAFFKSLPQVMDINLLTLLVPLLALPKAYIMSWMASFGKQSPDGTASIARELWYRRDKSSNIGLTICGF